MKHIIEKIIGVEQEMFNEMENYSGRASCPNDQKEFLLVRRCQFNAWSEVLLKSYLDDLKKAQADGKNMINEKNIRMMEFSDPIEYERLTDQLPEFCQQKKEYINRIVKIQIAWMENVTIEYPLFVSTWRSAHSMKDNQEISVESNLYSELSTYSIETVKKYWDYIKEIIKDNGNLDKTIFTNIAIAQGYSDLSEAEKKLNSIQ